MHTREMNLVKVDNLGWNLQQMDSPDLAKW